jgi:hypothetical protein
VILHAAEDIGEVVEGIEERLDQVEEEFLADRCLVVGARLRTRRIRRPDVLVPCN